MGEINLGKVRGEDGASVYIKYNTAAQDAGATDTWSSGQDYIGTATAKEKPANGYRWMKFIGDNGANGKNCFIKYSDSADGSNATTTWTLGQSYIGFATSDSATAPATGYTWSRFIPEVVDNLASTSSLSILSANQGRILNEEKASLTGAVFTGPVSVGPTNNIHFTAYSELGYVRTFGGNPDGVLIDARNTTDINNRRLIGFATAKGCPSLADSLGITDVVNGNYASYRIYGEHNPPMQLVAFLQPGETWSLNQYELANYLCIGEWNTPFTFSSEGWFDGTSSPTILSAQVIPYDTTSMQWYNAAGATSVAISQSEVTIKATTSRVRIFKQKMQ